MRRAADLLARNAWPLGVAAAAFTVAVGLPASDPDMWWHLASGRWMVEHRELLRVDIFSSTMTGSPYALGEIWGEILLYLAYLGGSWGGVAILRAALVAVTAFAVVRAASRFASPLVAIPLSAVAIVLSKPTWTDRPQLFTLALFAILFELLLAARGGSRRAVVASVPLLFVWSGLHAGYALGIALLWLFAIAALIERRGAVPFLAAAVVATVAVSLDPAALPLTRALDHVGSATRGIVEESPVDALSPYGALFALVLGGTLAAFLLVGADLLAVVVLAPLLALALSAQRHIPFFAIVAVPFVARSVVILVERGWAPGSAPPRAPAGVGDHPSGAPLTVGWSWVKGWRSEGGGPTPVKRVSVGAPGAQPRILLPVALWVGAIASIATADPRPDLRAYPAAALPALRASTGVVLNEYDWGGYLIWNAPERPVFIDGRLFPFLADDVLGGYRRAIHVLPGWRGVLDRWSVTQALLAPDRSLTQALQDDGWIVRARGDRFVLLERPK